MTSDILLESGTNEVEILELILGDQSFGINVAKVLQIVPYDETMVTHLPESEPGMLGTFLWRDRSIPLIDLAVALRRTREDTPPERPVVLVTEFNRVVNAFLIHGVNRIHRIGWDAIQPTNAVLSVHSSRVTGTVHVGDTDILLVDFEYLIADLFPGTRMGYGDESMEGVERLEARGTIRILLAEDSSFIRQNILKNLHSVGYTEVTDFENGEDCYNHILELKRKMEEAGRPFADAISLLITDIEMPRMDGLTLCRRFKEELKIRNVPVVVFSSLINEQMALKCDDVGADAHITKPELVNLVDLVDKLCLPPLSPAAGTAR